MGLRLLIDPASREVLGFRMVKGPKARHEGCLILALHAHLPYARHPRHEFFLEESWLYEALIETYIPLVELLSALNEEGTDFRLTVSLSPTLLEMLDDGLLRERFLRHTERLIELSEREVRRTKNTVFAPLSRMYNGRLRKARRLYKRWGGDLTGRLSGIRGLELITTAGTHAYLPALSVVPSAVRAQIETGISSFRRRFGRPPAGLWLPECGYYEGLDRLLSRAGVRYSFLSGHGILLGKPRPLYGIYRPVRCPAGIAVFGRDRDSAKEVWSRHDGYPGDPDYREFYRDIGWDLPLRYLRPFIHPDGIRAGTGIKYYRITGDTERKKPYVRGKARGKAALHAEDFILKRQRQVRELSAFGFRPVITAPYDAELFGHWWFEGIEWLGAVLRGLSRQRVVRIVTPSEYLDENPDLQTVSPTLSSWGKGGYSMTWASYNNQWALRHIHRAAEKMEELSRRFKKAKNPLLRRALNQARREALLMQASDWPFMIERQSAPDYGRERLIGHINAFRALDRMLEKGKVDEGLLCELEAKDGIFPAMDFRSLL